MQREKVTIYNREGKLSSREYTAEEREILLLAPAMSHAGVAPDTLVQVFAGRPVKQVNRLCEWAMKKKAREPEWDASFHLSEWARTHPLNPEEVA